jgi:tetratricopeptide (TPR) repeat protein
MQFSDHVADSNAPDAGVQRLRSALAANNFQEVVDEAQVLLAARPSDRDLLYFLAVAQRMLQRIPEALATLAILQAAHPKFSRAWQEMGHCHVFRRNAPAAIGAFERAIQINPALDASWRSLQSLYRIAGRADASQNAEHHLARLASLPREVTTARGMVADGDFRDAEALIRPYLARHPEDIEALRVLAAIASANDFALDTEALLARVVQLAPDYNAARYDYALALADMHKHGRAREELERLLHAEPGNPGALITYAGVLMSLGDLDASIERFRDCLRTTPRDPELNQSLGHAYKTSGRQAEAVAAYRLAAELRPGFGEPFWSLANLKTYRFTEEEIARMRELESQPVFEQLDRIHLCFALGKALEDRAEYADSFTYYERGNSLMKSTSPYQPDRLERALRRQYEICTPEFFAARRGWGCQSAEPIFILGLPRAGSTLLEQILASHSQVEGTMELANIPRFVSSLPDIEGISAQFPDALLHLTAEQCRAFGEAYLRDTRDYRTGKPRFIDKMPNNFRNIALIQLILPNATIIDARRDALDCCFGNFKQLYANGHQFAYSLEDIGRYYRSYIELMDHWEAVLPGRVLCARHEGVLDDLEGSVRRILDHCALPFEPECVDFHKTERRVYTASAEQVRRPINRDGVGQWRHYEPWLGPLFSALGLPHEAP